MTFSKQLLLRVTPELHRSIAVLAAEKCKPRSQLIIEALTEYLKKHEKLKDMK